MIFHHTALFGKDKWPEGIATWGIGQLEGKKMSSSKGHVVLPDNAIDDYGADTVRLFIFASREPWQDFDWRSDELERYKNKLRAFYERSMELHGSGVERQLTTLDRYALSRLQEIVGNATEAFEDFQTRKAGLNAFFELSSLINSYRRRADRYNEGVMNDLIETQVRLMAPFTPHICEELWTELGMEGLVSEADWPEPVEELRDEEIEQAQDLVESTVDDIRELTDIVDEDFEEIKVIVAEDWKREFFEELKDVVEDRPEFGEAMGRLTDGREQHAEEVKSYLQEYLEEPGDLPERIFSTEREKEILEENQGFIEDEFDAWVKVEREDDSKDEKASRAEPGKPAIVLE
jgi:leucyl-tRNA synthetase